MSVLAWCILVIELLQLAILVYLFKVASDSVNRQRRGRHNRNSIADALAQLSKPRGKKSVQDAKTVTHSL